MVIIFLKYENQRLVLNVIEVFKRGIDWNDGWQFTRQTVFLHYLGF